MDTGYVGADLGRELRDLPPGGASLANVRPVRGRAPLEDIVLTELIAGEQPERMRTSP